MPINCCPNVMAESSLVGLSETLIERKAGDAEACVTLLRRKQLLGDVVVQAFDWAFLADCHRLVPELALGALGSDPLDAQRLERIQGTGARVVGWNHKYLNADPIKAIHARGMKVWAYTVNDGSRAKELIADGIDGIITDDPALLVGPDATLDERRHERGRGAPGEPERERSVEDVAGP